MNIFIIGLPGSGRTTVADAICQTKGYNHIQAASWIKSTFRAPRVDEKISLYDDEYHSYLLNRIKQNSNLISTNITEMMKVFNLDQNVIDGIFSPKDFITLFDYNKDIVIFLNRINNETEYKDYENIGVSVMKDYCFWLASADLLPRQRWWEYNFQIPGEDLATVKELGSKNSVFIVKSINTAINHIKKQLVLMV